MINDAKVADRVARLQVLTRYKDIYPSWGGGGKEQFLPVLNRVLKDAKISPVLADKVIKSISERPAEQRKEIFDSLPLALRTALQVFGPGEEISQRFFSKIHHGITQGELDSLFRLMKRRNSVPTQGDLAAILSVFRVYKENRAHYYDPAYWKAI